MCYAWAAMGINPPLLMSFLLRVVAYRVKYLGLFVQTLLRCYIKSISIIYIINPQGGKKLEQEFCVHLISAVGPSLLKVSVTTDGADFKYWLEMLFEY